MKRAILIGTLAWALTTGSVHASGTFGSVPSSGDPVKDCGEWVMNVDGLPDEALEAIDTCLNLHGWTTSEDGE